ncbi:hypothetical protein ACFOOK_15875 [Micromonospora krabiensis]|uniref:Uncharacterized protein n=1 Tax=Micromonospora krabiensis TaxID=307121 RepID=A0A1C3N0I0_9ACTN|nr:hypothetical protein [Micromonospora krabiensis]SBV26079.1 hypothetical protein GA0070620_1561 [Micromonospora krabiensis]
MTTSPSPQPSQEPGDSGRQRQNWVERRREKIRAEIERNRRGEYTVPTWVLALALVLIVGGWLALIFLA